MTDKLALVTGAGSGIGKAIALGFATQGDRVIAADLDKAAAEATAKEHPDLITALPVDVADRSQVDTLRDRTHAEVGVPNVVVNAAGWDRTDQFLNATTEFAEKVVAINYLGPVHVCSAFLPGMIEAGGGGRVVNLASDAGRVGSAGETIYAGAKGGVIALTKSLARETARHAITINCVCPGPTDTPTFRRPARETERGSGQSNPVSPTGPPGGSRRAGAVLRFRRRVVHHRAGDQRQRRTDDGRMSQ